MIVNIATTWASVSTFHSKFVDERIAHFLWQVSSPPDTFSMNVLVDVTDFVTTHWEVIASPTATKYRNVIRDYDRVFPPGSRERIAAIEIFKRIFNYEEFSKKPAKAKLAGKKHGWCAYDLCQGSKWIVCPYCHIVTTETVLEGPSGKGYRPPLDHYYDKANYPFLALSLGNLIPCCAICNGPSFKGSVDFAKKAHLHPFKDVENIVFELRPIDPSEASDPFVSTWNAKPEKYELAVLPSPNTKCRKSSNSIRTFQLEHKYLPHITSAILLARQVSDDKEEKKQIALGLKKRSSSSLDAMIRKACGLIIKERRFTDFDPANAEEYKNRSLGKMRLDVFRAANAKP